MALKYSGPLFGKIGIKHIPLKAHSDDVDKMECDIASLRSALAEKTAQVEALEKERDTYKEQRYESNKDNARYLNKIKRLREVLTNIHDYGLDHDGETTAEKLCELVDELVELAREALADEPPKRGLKGAVYSIRERLGKDFDALADEPQTACTWTESPEGYWSTSCGRTWTFIEGGPIENEISYCHGCGKPVRIADEPNKEE